MIAFAAGKRMEEPLDERDPLGFTFHRGDVACARENFHAEIRDFFAEFHEKYPDTED